MESQETKQTNAAANALLTAVKDIIKSCSQVAGAAGVAFQDMSEKPKLPNEYLKKEPFNKEPEPEPEPVVDGAGVAVASATGASWWNCTSLFACCYGNSVNDTHNLNINDNQQGNTPASDVNVVKSESLGRGLQR